MALHLMAEWNKSRGTAAMESSFILKHEQVLFAELSKTFFTCICFHYIHYIWGDNPTL